jgi:3-oxoacyl-[acyl-carrier protein] reductase
MRDSGNAGADLPPVDELFRSISPRYPELRGKIAIITGSSRGIGKGIAIRLACEGMRIVVNGRSAPAVGSTARALESCGAKVLPLAADVGLTDDIDRLFAETRRAFGGVHLLVNNAASLRREHFFSVDEALLDMQLRVNVRGPHLCSQRAADLMRRQGGGSIIHISSVGGLRAHWRGLPYDVTKGAIDAMTRAMAIELASAGIRVNAVAPGAIATERSMPRASVKSRALAERIPLGRRGTPLEIGAVVAFLASDEASYITGHVVYVDGGITAQLSPRTAQL